MKFPLWKGYVTQQFKSTHPATDKGWLRVGITKPKIYSFADGVCVQSMYSATYGGNGISVQHSNISKFHDYITRYFHLDSRALKVGDKVNKGGGIGIGGNTGLNSTGDHLHYEVWIVPKGYKFSAGDRTKYAVNPLHFAFIQPLQPFTGEGVRVMTLDLKNCPIAKPTTSIARMRSSATTQTSANILVGLDGKPIYVPIEGLPFLGETVEVIDGYRWSRLVYNGDEVWVASTLLKVEPKTITVIKEVIKEVIKIVEVVKPINTVFNNEDMIVTLDIKPITK